MIELLVLLSGPAALAAVIMLNQAPPDTRPKVRRKVADYFAIVIGFSIGLLIASANLQGNQAGSPLLMAVFLVTSAALAFLGLRDLVRPSDGARKALRVGLTIFVGAYVALLLVATMWLRAHNS